MVHADNAPETNARAADAKALVGACRHGDVQLVLDATGGCIFVSGAARVHGTFDAFPRGVRLSRDDGGVAEFHLFAEALRDVAPFDLARATPQRGVR